MYEALPKTACIDLVASAPSLAAWTACFRVLPLDSAEQKGANASTNVQSPGCAGVCLLKALSPTSNAFDQYNNVVGWSWSRRAAENAVKNIANTRKAMNSSR